MKKILIIYESFHHFNTKKIMEQLALQFHCDIFNVNEIKDLCLKNYDIIILGSGIYYFTIGNNLDNYIKDNLNILKEKDLFLLTTSGINHTKYENKAVKLLNSYGLNIIKSYSCLGYDTYGILKYFKGIAKGHPNNDDIYNALITFKTYINSRQD